MSPARRITMALLAAGWLALAAGGCHRAPPPAAAPAASPAARGAVLRPGDLSWEFGAHPAGQDLQHVFVLHNDGDAAYHIRRARPG